MKLTFWILIVIFILSGILHLVNPQAFMWLMPPWLPEQTLLIYVSGVLELVCAVGLLLKQRWAGWLSALVLLGIWPANIWFAFDSVSSENMGLIIAAWLRLPLQIPLIWASIKFAQLKQR
ncbi:MAG: hypothetical protein RIQ88_867 [Actinomycetota bacterium]